MQVGTGGHKLLFPRRRHSIVEGFLDLDLVEWCLSTRKQLYHRVQLQKTTVERLNCHVTRLRWLAYLVHKITSVLIRREGSDKLLSSLAVAGTHGNRIEALMVGDEDMMMMQRKLRFSVLQLNDLVYLIL